jgi:NADPH-dependent ferric siderophore reductase
MASCTIIPDLAFGLLLPDGSRHYFVVEIDRGTMPIVRADITQTSFERKMRAYLTAHSAKARVHHFGWNTFRVLTVTTDHHRMQSMKEALHQLHVPRSPGDQLFYFAARDEIGGSDPLTQVWHDGNRRDVGLI